MRRFQVGKKMLAFCMMLVMVCSLGGCGSSSSGGESKSSDSGSVDADMSLKIICTPDAQSGGLLTIAKELGYFEEEGLDVDLQYVTTLSDMASIIGGGSCDVAFNSYYTVLTWLDAGMDVKIIAANNNIGGTQCAAIRDDITLNSPKDLEGLKLGLVPGAEVNVVFMRMCEEYGVDYDSIEKVELQPADQLSAFEAGDIDILACWEPYITKTEMTLNGRFLLSGTKCDIEGIPEEVEWLDLYETTVTTQKVIDEKSEALAKMLKAVQKASDYVNSKREDSVKIIAEAIDFDETELTSIMERNDYCWGVTEHYKESMTSLGDYMVEKEIIKSCPDFDSFHDFSVLKDALPEYYEIQE